MTATTQGATSRTTASPRTELSCPRCLRSTPRGGFFDHAHIAGAIRMICNEPALNPTAVRMAGRVGQSMEEFTDRQALKIRVMLAHLRVKREGYISGCSKSADYEPRACTAARAARAL